MKVTHIDHAAYQASLATKSVAELMFTIVDAKAAIAASPNGHKAGYYADEVSYAAMEIKSRRSS